MMETILDSHKLMYHPKRVGNWLEGNSIYPITVEISPTSACNHRCIFCGPSFFLNYKVKYLDTSILKSTIYNMSEVGVKAIIYAGEGEPLLHNDISSIINHTKLCGMNASLTTNGSLMNKNILDSCMKSLSWIKVSVDANKKEIYEKIHRCPKGDLNKVFNNLEYAVKLKKKYDLKCTIGTQALLLEDNKDDISNLVIHMKNIGVDYIVIKPLSIHPDGTCKNLKYQNITDEIRELEKYSNEKFKVIIRNKAFQHSDETRPYDKCYAQDFMAHIDSIGGVHSCINYIGQKEFCYGNIYENTFENIWKNKHTIKPDISKCRDICRLDECNRYLWKLKNPPNHINFI